MQNKKYIMDSNFGSIDEIGNLISEFKKTVWWYKYHYITARGGHYYFDTDFHANNNWYEFQNMDYNTK